MTEARLQWGRDRMAAEGCGATGFDPRRSQASMGPRPDGRGRIVDEGNNLYFVPLQWGRDRMAAEGRVQVDADAREHTLQWGRDRMAAEGGALEELFHGGQAALQWGRDRMAAEGRRNG